MLFVILGAHLLDQEGVGGGVWVLLALQFLVYPHVLYLWTLRANDFRQAELNNLLLDPFLFSLWAAALGFPLWITFTLYISAIVNNGIYRGMRGVAPAVASIAAGTLLALGLGGLRFSPETNLPTSVLCMVGLAFYLARMFETAHARNQVLYDTRAQLRSSEQALKASNWELQQQSAAKTRFLAYAGHDLRQPLQAMHLFLASLMNSGLDKQQENLARMLQASADALDSLLDSLLAISKLDAGVIRPELQALDVDVLLAKLVQEFEAQARAKGLRLTLWAPAEAVTVMTDERLLSSVLRNLMANAIKYTQQGGVLLAVRRRAPGVSVQVWDTGPGIADAEQQHIFKEFYQVDNPQRDRTRGLGLGLSIVRRISDLLQLDVACRSRLGRGTVMTLALPLAAGDRGVLRPAAETPPQAPALDLMGLHVVLLEDAAEVAAAQTAWLTSCRARVTHFASAEEALAQDDQIRAADFFLCDYRLPGSLTGLDFLHALQARHGKIRHAALLTGDTSADFIEMATASGWPVLFKPIQPARLQHLLVPWLKNRGNPARP
jgi:signal transduction histidine kinase